MTNPPPSSLSTFHSPLSTAVVFAVTLNWNRPQDTLLCLASLQAQSYPALRLVVVDNGSTDDSVAQIRAAFPDVAVIENGRNAGFAGGMNPGIRYALEQGADYVFALNNDTTLDPQAIRLLVERLEHQAPGERLGLVAPLIYYHAEPTRVWSLGGHLHPLTLEVTEQGRGQIDNGQWGAWFACDFVAGCAMLVPRHVWQEVGLFDEGFFMYYEDVDFCLRLRRAGYGLGTLTAAKMWHKVSLSSGGADSPNERYWMARSSVRYFGKYTRGAQWLAVGAWRLGSALRTTWRLWRGGKPAALKAYWAGLRDGWKT